MTPIDKLSESYPRAKKALDSIARIHRLVDSFEIAPFFEPPSLFDLGKKPQPLFLTSDLLATWIQHISHGTRVRLRSLEAGFLSELSAGRFMTAMILARSHMENAGLAAFAEQELLKASETANWEDLKPIIQQMLFGTSFRFEKKLTLLQDELPLEATLPVRPNVLLESMDGFLIGTGSQIAQLRGAYALLCEYAHPNIGGAKAFENIVTPEDGKGWIHHYGRQEDIGDDGVVAATNILLVNMKVGYTNAFLLVTGEIEELPGSLCYHKPSIGMGKTIWDEVLQA